MIEILDRRIGVNKAVLNTIHAYTSSQFTVDAGANKPERGRAGAVNLVPTSTSTSTSTGAAKTTTRVLEGFRDRFDCLAVRAPIPLGSVTDITLVTARETSAEEINDIFREENISDRNRNVLGVSDAPIVFSDIVQDPHAAIVDLSLTRVVAGDLVKVMA